MVHRGSARRACFHARPRDWLIDRPQSVQVHSGSVFHRSDSPSEFLRISRCVALSYAATTCLGFCPPLDITSSLPIRRASNTLLAPAPVFSTVRRLLQEGLRAYFIPQPSSGLFLVQGFDPSVQPSDFISLVPPMPLSLRMLTCRARPAATYRRLDSDVLLHTKSLSTGSVISLPHGRTPLRVCLLLQAIPTPAKMSSSPSSTHAVAPTNGRSTSAHCRRRTRAPVARGPGLPELFRPSNLLFKEQ